MEEVLVLKLDRHWLERLADQGDLPGESLRSQPLVELAGKRRVLIEGHSGVSQYGKKRICVEVSYGAVAVEGFDLELARMTKAQLIIRGRIDRICVIRRDC